MKHKFNLHILAKFKLALAMILAGVSPSQGLAIPVTGHKMMISAPNQYAVEVAQEIIDQGGNVVDVAVAIGLTLSVTSPFFASLGGGGFALLKMKDSPVEALDFRETAPLKTNPEFFENRKDGDSIRGGAAVAVPGFPAGLWELHKKYGRLKWSQLFQSPIRLATRGFRVSGDWVAKTKRSSPDFNPAGIQAFLNKGEFFKPGEVLRQLPLSRALKEFSRRNIEGFYTGPVAQDIVETVRQNDGVLELDDLKNYRVRWLKPLELEFKGYKIYSMPPPSSGGIVIQTALHLVDQLKPDEQELFSANEFHLLGEILDKSFRGRVLLGDPDFHKNPIEKLTSETYLKELKNSISLRKVSRLAPLKDQSPDESSETTHYSVMDAEGNAVALTVTLNGNYGSKVVSNRFQIALNNEMDDFTTQAGKPNMFGLIQGHGNRVQPGKRPLSSMSPTLVEKEGEIILSVGAPGGPRIISGVFQALYRILARGQDIDRAIQSPRVHHQFDPHVLYIDYERFSPEVVKALKAKGHVVKEGWQSKVYGVYRNKEGLLEAAFDSRGEGAAGGR